MIKLEKVSKKFGIGPHVLSDINISVDKGEFIFLVGPTGSGKSTIFKLIIREFLPTEGSITVDECKIMSGILDEYAGRMASSEQSENP